MFTLSASSAAMQYLADLGDKISEASMTSLWLLMDDVLTRSSVHCLLSHHSCDCFVRVCP